MKTHKNCLSTIAAMCLLFTIGLSAQALPITGTIDNGPFYSLVHAGTDPYNPGDPDDWLFFESPATFMFDLTGGIVTTSGNQQYSLMSNNGATAIFDILDLFIDTNNPDGFAGGTLVYELDGAAGTFTFDGQIFGTTLYNSSTFDGTNFRAYAWGADLVNDLSLDLRISGTHVPEPGTLGLIGLGLLGLAIQRRKS